MEVLGWAGRTWAAECPYNSTAFMIQISTLIIGKQQPSPSYHHTDRQTDNSEAPTFYTAAIYVLLGRFIQLFGRQSSILSPRLYLWIFCTCDIISLVIQAAGGGLASSESDTVNGNTAPGTNTMVAGIVFQLVSLTIFVFCAVDFFRRSMRLGYLQSLLHGSLAYLVGAMVLSVVCIYIRSIYRTIELAQGWSGYLITHESYFVGLDGVMMVIAVGVFNIFHPGWLLPADHVFAKNQAYLESGVSEEHQLHSSTEYTGYGHQ